jgi:hypothetical protein
MKLFQPTILVYVGTILFCIFPVAQKICNTKVSKNFIKNIFYIKRFKLILITSITAMKLILQLIINVFLLVLLHLYNRKAALSLFRYFLKK